MTLPQAEHTMNFNGINKNENPFLLNRQNEMKERKKKMRKISYEKREKKIGLK